MRSKLTKKQIADMKRMIAAYRRKQQEWSLTCFPSMPEDEWKAYLAWVAAYGGTRQRRFKRRMTAGRDIVTVAVANQEDLSNVIRNTANVIHKGGAPRLMIRMGRERAVMRRGEDGKPTMSIIPPVSLDIET